MPKVAETKLVHCGRDSCLNEESSALGRSCAILNLHDENSSTPRGSCTKRGCSFPVFVLKQVSLLDVTEEARSPWLDARGNAVKKSAQNRELRIRRLCRRKNKQKMIVLRMRLIFFGGPNSQKRLDFQNRPKKEKMYS